MGGAQMKRWVLLVLVVIVVAASLLLIRLRLNNSSFFQSHVSQGPVNHLQRMPNSGHKYDLCIEAFALSHAPPDYPYKTNVSFHDPFRNTTDTIIPLLMGLDLQHKTVSFTVTIIVSQVATYSDSIAHVSVQDGISVMLPDKNGHLQRSNQPQFIVSYIDTGGQTAVLDYTCSQEWHWSAVPTRS
jgi:hypothetical protein